MNVGLGASYRAGAAGLASSRCWDTAGAKILASECLRDAKKAGMNEAAVIKAAGGNLATFMLTELESLPTVKWSASRARKD
jgi:hypothetical protein